MRVAIVCALAACGPRAVPATAPDAGWCAHDVVVVPKTCPPKLGLVTHAPPCTFPTAKVCGTELARGTVYACRRGDLVEKVEAWAPGWRLVGQCEANRADGTWTEYESGKPNLERRYTNGEYLGTSRVEQ